MKGSDVLVVGGGVIGLSAAWRMLQAGRTVTVLDAGHPGRASWAAAGMLTPVTEAYWGEDALLALTIDSLGRWPVFAAELEEAAGVEVGLELDGVLAVGYDLDDAEVIDDLHQLHVLHDLPSERLRSRECRAREPLLAPSVRSGLWARRDGSVDPRHLLEALRIAVERAGGRLVAGEAREIVVEAGRVTGARDDRGHHGADRVVMAAGAWSPLLEGIPGAVVPPVRPVYGEVLRLHERTPADTPGHTIRSIVKGHHVYVVPRASGEIVVGATSIDRGYDTRVTAGGVYELLRDALLVLPGLSEAELVEHVAGLRPGTPDNAPIVGWSDVEGLFLATGHYRNGILLTPVTADAVGAALDDGPIPPVVECACQPDRFEMEVS